MPTTYARPYTAALIDLPVCRPAALAGSRVSDEEFAECYRRLFAPLVSRVTWRFGLSREDARDIVQDAFTIALSKLDADGNPRAWLVRVVDYLAVNHRRKTRRRSDLMARWNRFPAEREG